MNRIQLQPPDHSVASSSGPDGDWVLLTTAVNLFDAHLLCGRLDSEGFETRLDRFNPNPGAWLTPFGNPRSPVRVFVHRFDFEAASFLLVELEQPTPDPPSTANERGALVAIVTASVIGVVVLLAGLEILGFAPCVVGVLCF